MSIASLYPSINPSLLLDFANSKVLDPRITFTRTTTATYYDGVTTAKAEENLLTYSQDFTSGWTQNNVTVTANSVAAPDGTTTADTVTPNTTNTYHRVIQTVPGSTTGLTVTYSVYVKANGYTVVALREGSTNGSAAVFSLSGAGSLLGYFNNPTYVSGGTITDVGNGWFRISAQFFNVPAQAVEMVVLNSWTSGDPDSATYAGNGTSGMYLWGAQAEIRSSATAYTATTTQAITNYIPVLQTAAAGQARFDHNPTTGESLGLLIEEARTNACPYSEAIGSWSALNATAQSNVTIAPSGALTADKILPNATASVSHGWYNTITAAASTTYTISIFAKAAEYSWLYLTEGNNVTATAWFNLSTGALGTVTGTGSPSATITWVGNGWYRCSLTFTTAVGATEANIQARVTTADNTISFTASSSTVGYSGIFVWGGQFETGSFATSYIPTTGSTATRNADAASMTGTNFSSWFNNGEGTLYGEMQRAQGAISGTNFHIATIGNSSSSGNYYKLRFQGSSTARAALSWTSGAEQCAFIEGTTTAGNFYKLCLGVKVNDFGFSSDNTTASTDTSGTVPLGLNLMYIGADADGTSQLANNRIRKLAYYPIRVTNAQLQSLTV